MERIIRAYSDIHKRIDNETKLLIAEIDNLTEAGETPSKGKIIRLERYKRLIAEVQDELEKYTKFMAVELSGLGKDGIARGLEESAALVTGPHPELKGVFRDLAPEAVETMLGFLDPKGPLYARLEMLPGYIAKQYSQKLLDNIALGRNPRVLARELTNTFGLGLSESLRMARTVTLYSYRESSRANYIANNRVIVGWQWMASLDNRTCPACAVLHGKVFESNDPLAGHHNCRCTMVPITILDPKPPIQETGIEWIERQSEPVQKELLGKGRYQAWKDGRFTLDQIPADHEDDVYGPMKVAKSLKDLIGE
jgi:SPP1 gp7 family putative phage head morphogenesis protein